MDVGVLYLRLFRKGVWRYLRIGGRKAEQVSRPFRFYMVCSCWEAWGSCILYQMKNKFLFGIFAVMVLVFLSSCGDEEEEKSGVEEEKSGVYVDGMLCHVDQERSDFTYDEATGVWKAHITFREYRNPYDIWELDFKVYNSIGSVDLNDDLKIHWFRELSLMISSQYEYDDYQGTLDIQVNGRNATLIFKSFSFMEYRWSYSSNWHNEIEHTINGQIEIEYILE